MEKVISVMPNYMKFCDGSNGIYQYDELPAIKSIPNLADAVIIGAGPSGLIASLVLAERGFNDIIILEKRNSFNRLNFITLYPETLAFLKKLNLIDDILKLCTPIKSHQFYVNRVDQINFISRNEAYQFSENLIDKDTSYDSESIQNFYLGEGVLMARLCEFQDLLLKKILENKKIRIYFNALGQLIRDPSSGNTFSVRVNESRCISSPKLIVLSDGVRSKNIKPLGINLSEMKNSMKKEFWHIAHCELNEASESNLCYKFDFDDDALQSVSYGLTSPKHKEISVAYCYQEKVSQAHLLKNAEEVANLHGVKIRKLKWYSKPIPVSYLISHQSAKENVVLLGDAVGVGSPNAGLGSVLGLSAYGWCLGEYVKRLLVDKDEANYFYNSTTRSYVKHWQSRSMQIWKQIQQLKNFPSALV